MSAGWSVWLAVAGVLIMLSLLAVIPWLRRPQGAGFLARTLMKSSTLQARLWIGFCLAAIVPVVTLLPLLAAISTDTAQKNQLPHVERLAHTIATNAPQLVQDRVTGIGSLAGHVTAANKSDKRSLRNTLLRHHAANQAFASLWIARPDGTVVVATSVDNGNAVPWSGPAAGVSMMEPFKAAMTADKLYVSSVQKGAAADAAPMLFVSAPVTINGNTHWGFVQGLLNLRTVVGGLVGAGAVDGVLAVIADQQNRVILASPELAMGSLSDLSAHPLLTAAPVEASGKSYQFSAALGHDGYAVRTVAVRKSLDNGWQVFAAATQASINTTLVIYTLLGLIWVAFALALGRGLAALYGQVVAQPLQQLEASLDDFDSEHTMTMIPPPPANAPQEIRQTYSRVRKSMRSSRDAYRNMIKAVTEGAELRHQLSKVKGKAGAVAGPSGGAGVALAQAHPQAHPEPDETWVGRLDSVTELSGLNAFDGFFSEAWTLGVADSRPMSIVLVRFAPTDDQTLKSVAQQVMSEVGRPLDLVARIAAWEFALIMPDTDLDGSLAVAEKIRALLLPNGEHDLSLEITLGVASIVPNEKGNAKSFLDMCHRALVTADQAGDGNIAFVSSKGKIELRSAADADDSMLIDWDPCDEASA